MNPPRSHQPGQWHPLAAVIAWVIPGGGHFVLGEKTKGVILAISIGLLWVGGLLIGGVHVCDRDDHPWWFYPQVCIAPTWVGHWYQSGLQVVRSSPSASRVPRFGKAYEPSYGFANEQGILYTALAGLLNLLAILDVVYRDDRSHAPIPRGAAVTGAGS